MMESFEKEMMNAMKELEQAKQEIEKLNKNREKAMKEVTQAVAAVKKAENDTEHKGNYSSQSYWESRYTDIDSNLLNKATINEKPNFELYEWYLSFDKLKEYLERDIKGLMDNTILVPGCGNSGLCEDLSIFGLCKVFGMDYSREVINKMKKRAVEKNLNNISYFEADARRLDAEFGSFFGIILDKGTIDAITSAGDDQNKQQDDAGRYMREMWRVLQKNGLFIAISTMPPDIFEIVAINPLHDFYLSFIDFWKDKNPVLAQLVQGLLAMGKGKDKIITTNWFLEENGCVQEKLKTEEGGDIYYYCVKKLNDFPDFEDKNVTQSIIDDIQKAMSEETSKNLPQHIPWNIPGQENKNIHDTSNPRNEEAKYPSVGLLFHRQESQLIASGYVDVSFVLQAQVEEVERGGVACESWEENDGLYLVCSPLPGNVENPFKIHSELKEYETFEYTTCPVDLSKDDTKTVKEQLHQQNQSMQEKRSTQEEFSSKLQLGRVKIQLPSYGGWFRVCYVRTCTSLQVGAQQQPLQHLIVLGVSECFSVKSPIFGAGPDERILQNNNQIQIEIKDSVLMNKTVHKHVRRRGIGTIIPDFKLKSKKTDAVEEKKEIIGFRMTAEDNKQIQVFHITASLCEDHGDNFYICRVMAWMNEKEEGFSIIIEADIEKEGFKRTVYGSLTLIGIEWMDLKKQGLQIDVGTCWTSVEDSRVVCRVPYKTHINKRDLLDVNKLLGGFKERSGEVNRSINCLFCGLNVMSSESELRTKERESIIKYLPSGVFDHMMHDFICCEGAAHPLSSEEIEPSPGELLFGSVSVTVASSDISGDKLSVCCKNSSSLLEVLSVAGVTLATTPWRGRNLDLCEGGEGSVGFEVGVLKENFRSAINLDTCWLRCGRCFQYLGEGRIKLEETETENQTENETVAFSWSDVNDLTFSLHCVELKGFISSFVSIEQVLARMMVRIRESHGFNSFCIYVQDGFLTSTEALDIKTHGNLLQIGKENLLFINLLNNNYAFLDCNDCNNFDFCGYCNHLSGFFKSAIKVSFIENWLDFIHSKVFNGSVARIPLQSHEFRKILSLLSCRSGKMTSYPVKNQKSSFLYLN